MRVWMGVVQKNLVGWCYSPKWHISSCDHFPMISSHVDTSWKSLKFTKKTPKLEDPYIEFYNSVWPHLYTIGKVFQLAKTFQKTPKSENAQKYPKNEFFFMCTWVSLRTPMYVRDCLYIIPTYASKKCQKNMNLGIWVVWVVMQLIPSVLTTVSSTLTLH